MKTYPKCHFILVLLHCSTLSCKTKRSADHCQNNDIERHFCQISKLQYFNNGVVSFYFKSISATYSTDQ